MIRRDSRLSTKKLLQELEINQNMHRLAVRRDDIRAVNRHIERVWGVLDALAETAEGRSGLERLLAHPDAYTRLRAAEAVMAWAPEAAIPVLGRLLFEDLGPESSAAERIDIRTAAKDTLYDHFDITSWDRNDLIEPLKAYGVDLPYRDRSKW